MPDDRCFVAAPGDQGQGVVGVDEIGCSGPTHPVDERREVKWVDDVIVVEKGHVLAARSVDAIVHCQGATMSRIVDDVLQFERSAIAIEDCADVVAAVVHDDHLERPERLLREAVERDDQICRAIAGSDDDAHDGLLGRWRGWS